MNQERIYHVLVAPVASEKAIRVADQNRQYVFKVRPDSNKTEIRQAIEQLFNVQVQSVNTLNVAGKTRRFGRGLGRRSDWKKAYVTLKEGQEINYAGSIE